MMRFSSIGPLSALSPPNNKGHAPTHPLGCNVSEPNWHSLSHLVAGTALSVPPGKIIALETKTTRQLAGMIADLVS